MVRGSGHSFEGQKRGRHSILRRSGKAANLKGEDAVFDLILLNHVDENSVVQNIKDMYFEDMIYSYIGNVVIAVNPFRKYVKGSGVQSSSLTLPYMKDIHRYYRLSPYLSLSSLTAPNQHMES